MRKWFTKHPAYSWKWYHWLAYYCLLVGASFTMIGLGHLSDHRPFVSLETLKTACISAGIIIFIKYFVSRERRKSS